MSNKVKVYRIYTKRVAYELRKRGFKFIKTEVNKNFPQYLVYLFEDTPELRKALQEITHHE